MQTLLTLPRAPPKDVRGVLELLRVNRAATTWSPTLDNVQQQHVGYD